MNGTVQTHVVEGTEILNLPRMKLDDVAVIEKVTGVLPCLLDNALNLTRGHTLHPNTVPTRHTATLVAARYGDHHEVARGNLPVIC